MTPAACRRPLVTTRHPGFHLVLWTAAVLAVSTAGAQEHPPPAAAPEPSAPAASSHVLIVGDLAGETITISSAEFAELPQTSVRAAVPHEDRTAIYEGVLLGHVLQEAGVQPVSTSSGEKELPRPLRSAYVLLEAADGYQVVFSLPEAFPEHAGREVLLADRMDGRPLTAKAAPYRLVVAGSRQHERWIRQVRRILVQPATASAFRAPAAGSSQPVAPEPASGGVYLVGTGPGDPDLITVRAADVLRRADLVLCFSWMKDDLAAFVRPGVVEVASPLLQGGRYFGPAPEEVSDDLRDRIVRAGDELTKLRARLEGLVAEGKTIVFADNGDPMIFSPWSWVPEQLAGFNPIVIPGLSSFNAANAAVKRSVAGLGYVILSSGKEMGEPDENGRLAGTVVFFTHRTKLHEVLPRLEEKYPADTPVAIVCNVSLPTEKVLHGTLATIAEKIGEEGLPHLYLFYVGDGLLQSACCR